MHDPDTSEHIAEAIDQLREDMEAADKRMKALHRYALDELERFNERAADIEQMIAQHNAQRTAVHLSFNHPEDVWPAVQEQLEATLDNDTTTDGEKFARLAGLAVAAKVAHACFDAINQGA